MSERRPRSDPRLNAARYRLDGSTPEEPAADDDPTGESGQTAMDQRAAFVEIQIQQAMRRGDFDDLPGAGKPLTGLGGTYDPNWWIRQKIERENLTDLGPPALTLRAENSALDERMDALGTEHEVRDLLTDFNRRVVEARRQLQGGPPVVTPVRDIDLEVERWRERRAAHRRAADADREREAAALAAMTRRERRRARRAARDPLR